MYNFRLAFTNPWLLFVFLPLLFTALFFHFKTVKKYRRTRNRIISLVLHLIVSFLAVLVLSGFTVKYQKNNDANEIYLLVDCSDSLESDNDDRDEFVKRILKTCELDGFKVGLIIFGFDQNYAIPLTEDIDEFYFNYSIIMRKSKTMIDSSASNIAGAIDFARNKVLHPDSSKIVLITDGIETDYDAVTAIRGCIAQGTILDTVYIGPKVIEEDCSITSIKFPDYHIKVNDNFEIVVEVYSNVTKKVALELYDNGIKNEAATKEVDLVAGEVQTFALYHSFVVDKLHEVNVNIVTENDDFLENNRYSSYYYLQEFNNVLVVERKLGESNNLISFLNAFEKFNITTASVNIADSNHSLLPTNMNDLLNYDQVILNNISNKDIESLGFDALLYDFVYDYGGGLFTSGGTEDDGTTPHGYNKQDIQNTLYQSILPIQVINYTPPVGLMVLIDTSGSMAAAVDGDISGDKSKATKVEMAVDGAWSCLQALSDRDYFGVVTFGTNARTLLPLIERTKEAQIRQTLVGVESSNDMTNFAPAIELAGKSLRDARVKKKHVILVTDGAPSDSKAAYMDHVIKNYGDGITFSIVDIENIYKTDMNDACEAGGGVYYYTPASDLSKTMRRDLFEVVKIHEVNNEDFLPVVYKPSSSLYSNVGVMKHESLSSIFSQEQINNMTETVNGSYLPVRLGGFYGGKLKSGAELIMSAEYDAPIYAQWKFGNGMVGCFMADLNDSSWSTDFMANSAAQAFISNVVENLMPITTIRPSGISIDLREDNYVNQLSVITDLSSSEKIEGKIRKNGLEGSEISLNKLSSQSGVYVTQELSADNNYSRSQFIIKEPGVYEIILEKKNASGTLIESKTIYKNLGYSSEYNTNVEIDNEKMEDALESLAKKTGGDRVLDLEDPIEIFSTFNIDIDKEYDPRYVFIIICLVSFLLDVAVRKFKFKWIHEIINDKKKIKNLRK